MGYYILFLIAMAVIFYTVTYPYQFKIKKKLNRIEKLEEVTFVKDVKTGYIEIEESEKKEKFKIEERFIDSIHVEEKMKYISVYPNREIKKNTPILFLLHGLKDRPEDWLERAKLLENYEALRKKGEVEDLIFILPASGHDGMAWYTNFYGDAKARYEEYFVRELLKEIKDAHPDSPLGIAGFSMGGYGAYKIGLKNLETFKVIGSISGAISLIRLSINRRVMRLFRYLYVPKFLFNNMDTAHFIRVFSSWGYKILKEDPYSLLKKRVSSLKGNRFYLSVGSEDKEPYLMFQQWIDVVGRLKKYNYFYKAFIYEGETHTWEYVSKDLQNFLKYFKKSINN